jgi:succinyl-CoA synthetase beta subunit
MKVHEYQAKELFARYGIPVPRGKLVTQVEEVEGVVNELGLPVVVKAQIHAGGRGKAGGVKLAKTLDEARQITQNMLGKPLVTHQTGGQGTIVRKVWVEEGAAIKKEFYVGMVIDRARRCPVLMVSPAGGMEIEELAKEKPELIFKEPIDPFLGLLPYQCRSLAFKLGVDPKQAGKMFMALTRLFVEKDCSLAEINPLILTEDGNLLAIDAKLNFDDSALFRHPDVKEMLDPDELDPLEYEASKYHLNYVRLDGNVGIMVNGAGLAMATMDVIKLAGAEPANFLDVGGSANAEMIAQGFKIILSDPNVKLIFINIFGGILRCDVLAQGVIEAAKQVEVSVPILVRLEGTNVEQGREMLADSGLNFVVGKDLSDAASKIVEILS